MIWHLIYEDKDSRVQSRAARSRDVAIYMACELLQQSYKVRRVIGPDGVLIEHAESEAIMTKIACLDSGVPVARHGDFPYCPLCDSLLRRGSDGAPDVDLNCSRLPCTTGCCQEILHNRHDTPDTGTMFFGGSVANISNGRAKPERPDYLILPVNRTAAPNTAPLSAATDPCGSCASTQRRLASRLRTRMI